MPVGTAKLFAVYHGGKRRNPWPGEQDKSMPWTPVMGRQAESSGDVGEEEGARLGGGGACGSAG
jgi:hypothetical protein